MFALLLSFCFFTPPSSWALAEPPAPIPYVQSYFTNGEGALLFSTEEVSVSLRKYTDTVCHLHAENPEVTCRDLGHFQSLAGVGRLLDLNAGPVRQLQFLLIHEGIAYILTGATSEENMGALRPVFLEAFRTLTAADSLSTTLPEGPLRTQFAEALNSLNTKFSFSDYEKLILSQYSSKGLHWQQIALMAGKKKIDSAKTL